MGTVNRLVIHRNSALMPSPPSPPAPPVPHASATHQTRCAREGHTLLRSRLHRLRARRHRQRLRVRRSRRRPTRHRPTRRSRHRPTRRSRHRRWMAVCPAATSAAVCTTWAVCTSAAGADNLGVALLTVQPRAHPAQRFLDVDSHHNHIAFDPGTGYGGWLIGLVGHQGFCGTPRQGLGMLDCGGSGSIWTPVRCG